MSWFGELVLAEAVAGMDRPAVIAAQSHSMPFCMNGARAPLRFGPLRDAFLRRVGAAVWEDRPAPIGRTDAAGMPALRGCDVLLDLRDLPDDPVQLVARAGRLAGKPPAIVRTAEDGELGSGWRKVWSEPLGGAICVPAGPEGEGMAVRLGAFVADHLEDRRDAFDTALAFARSGGLVTDIGFEPDGGAMIWFDPVWCLRGAGPDEAGAIMARGAVRTGPVPVNFALPPLGGAGRLVEIALTGATAGLAVEIGRVPVQPGRRGVVGGVRLRIVGRGDVRISGGSAEVTGIGVGVPPPLPGLFGEEFTDELSEFDWDASA